MRLVLLDRDGVINEERADYVKNPEELIIIDGAIEAIARLNQLNLKVAVVTNQAGVGKGLFSEKSLFNIHAKISRELETASGHIDKYFYCTAAPIANKPIDPRRKPNPGMLLEALMHFDVPAHKAVFIGDSLRDLQAAKAANIDRILVRTGSGAITENKGIPENLMPYLTFDNLHSAVQHIEQELNLPKILQ